MSVSLKMLSESLQGKRTVVNRGLEIKNKSLSTIIFEGVTEINRVLQEMSDDEAAVNNTIVDGIVNADNPEEVIASMEEDVANNKDGNKTEQKEVIPTNETVMIIRESSDKWYNSLWDKIKAFFQGIKNFILNIFAKIKSSFDAFFANNATLVSKYGDSVKDDANAELNVKNVIKPLPTINTSKIVTNLENYLTKFISVIEENVREYRKNSEGKRADNETKKQNIINLDNDELKKRLEEIIGNKDEFYTAVFNEIDKNKTYTGKTLSELQEEFRKSYTKEISDGKITATDIGGTSKIKQLLKSGQEQFKEVRTAEDDIKKALNSLQEKTFNNGTFLSQDRKNSELAAVIKTYISSGFTKAMDFVGESIKAVGAYINIWVRLKKEEMFIARKMFIKLYNKSTGKHIEAKPIGESVDDEMAGVVADNENYEELDSQGNPFPGVDNVEKMDPDSEDSGDSDNSESKDAATI